MTTKEALLAAATIVLSSGVIAAAVSGVMTERFERQRAIRDRRLNAAGDFVGAAAKATNAVDALAQEIHEPLPPPEQIDDLLASAEEVKAAIDAATERAGLVRVLYGPSHPDISGNSTLWANRVRRSVDGARHGSTWRNATPGTR